MQNQITPIGPLTESNCSLGFRTMLNQMIPNDQNKVVRSALGFVTM